MKSNLFYFVLCENGGWCLSHSDGYIFLFDIFGIFWGSFSRGVPFGKEYAFFRRPRMRILLVRTLSPLIVTMRPTALLYHAINFTYLLCCLNPRRAGRLDFPWSAGGGRFYAPPRLTRLLSYVATCGRRRRSKARPKALRK